MVMDANLRRIQAEKLLKESNAKVQINSLLTSSSNSFPILYNLVDFDQLVIQLIIIVSPKVTCNLAEFHNLNASHNSKPKGYHVHDRPSGSNGTV